MKKYALALVLSTVAISGSNQIAFLKQFIAPGDLVFDIGAHIGNKTSLYLACDAHVICIEPQPVCCALLHAKFNHNPQVTIDQIGIAEQYGQLTLAVCSSSTTISTFSQEWREKSRHKKAGYQWDTTIKVAVVPLDEMIKKYGMPRFCKIDVENYEYEVLKGLSKPITYLSFEFCMETIHNAQKCLDHLESLGYKKFNFAAAEYPLFIASGWLSKEKLLQSINAYQSTFLMQEHDDLWGDIYAYYVP